ncbi:BMP family ABC transporter substrate-binding protein [Nocardioides sp. zg-1230]|uniref:BMP family ABC transporter substrate-binding protein n=1 Tax=Nocardioides sp. zg-1230 TaxID=2736601 RepID=UPI0015548B1D|nr:BMP family ABC transporter substrate-binding protein [Nocardioides sp. zg-1230]
MGDVDTSCLIRLLGPVWVHPGLGARDLGSPKQAAVLAVLALRAGDVTPRDVLADLVWDGRPPRTYAHSLQLYVSALRRVLEESGSRVRIDTVHHGYRLDVRPDAVDVLRFRRMVADGSRLAASEDWSLGAATLEDALRLWGGTPLADVSVGDPPGTGSSLHELRLEALESLATVRLAQGDLQRAMAAAREVLSVDGLREQSRLVLMTALSRAGRQAEALRTYEEARRLLDDELGALPSAELRSVHARILQRDPSLEPDVEVTGPGSSPPDAAVGRDRPRAARVVVWLLPACVLLLAAALVQRPDPPGRSAATRLDPPGDVLLVQPSDGTLNSLIEQGFDRGVTEFSLVGRELVPETDDAAPLIDDNLREGALVVDFTLGTDLATLARRHPRSTFVALDDPDVAREPNLATVRFASQEAAYLAGHVAARTTRTGVVGFLGGVDFPTVWPFETGFAAGVEAADPDVRVLVRYLASPPDFGLGFGDPQAGEQAARRLFRDGADVVLAAAGDSGLGAFEAAVERSTDRSHLWVIGADFDHYEELGAVTGTADVQGWRSHVLTSAVLRFDQAVYDAVAGYARDDFRSGVHRYDLSNGGVGLAFSGGHLEELRPELEAVRSRIVQGNVAVACAPERVPPADRIAC